MDYQTNFIVNNGKLPIVLDDQKWLLRQPTLEEVLSGGDAYQLSYDKVINDKRLKSLAENKDALIMRARFRGLVARTIYMLPLLLQDNEGTNLYNVNDVISLEKFEQFCGDNPEILKAWSEGYIELMSISDKEVKKK